MTTYLLAGGGTAGHVNPLLAVADRLVRRDPTATVLVLGTAEGLEARLVPERGFELLVIDRVPLPRRPDRAMVRFPGRLRGTVDAVRAIIRDRHVDVVVGFGGYVSAPAYLAARAEHTPLAIHEANARPGIANRLGALFTDHVGVAFEGTRIRGATVVGMPLREEIETLDRLRTRAEGIRFFGLDQRKPTLLVTGGSSGARSINETLAKSATLILGTGWQIIHVTGEYRDQVVDPDIPGYLIVRYVDRMDMALAAADLTVCRSGTSTVAEVAALGLPAVFVPYPVGNGEQRLNARAAADAGGAIIVADARFSTDFIATELVPLLMNRAKIADMAVRIATTGTRGGTDQMIDLIDRAVAAS